MHSRNWQIIRDDSKKTFQVVSQESNTNFFFNEVYAMQRAGMNVTSVFLPVTNKNSNKDSVSFTGYKRDDALYERLQKEFRELSRKEMEGMEGEDEI